MNALENSRDFTRTIRRGALQHMLDAANRHAYTDSHMKHMLTSEEYERYKARLEEAKEEERDRSSPEDDLTGNARIYWDRVTALANAMAKIRRAGKNAITGQRDYSVKQKKQIRSVVDEAAELKDFFDSELSPSEQSYFRELQHTDPREPVLRRLEFDLPVIKTKGEMSPYGGNIDGFVQNSFLRDVIDEMSPEAHREIDAGAEMSIDLKRLRTLRKR